VQFISTCNPNGRNGISILNSNGILILNQRKWYLNYKWKEKKEKENKNKK